MSISNEIVAQRATGKEPGNATNQYLVKSTPLTPSLPLFAQPPALGFK